MNININNYGNFNEKYVIRIRETLIKALSAHPRTLLLRVDLRLPESETHLFNPDPSIITRFVASLKSQIMADIKQKRRLGKRTHDCSVRHIWVREFNQAGKPHYHVVLMFNKDTYAYPGTYKPKEGAYIHNLAFMIMEAWIRALNFSFLPDYTQYYSLVHFPANCYYHLNVNDVNFKNQLSDVIHRVNYLAKEYSKDYSDGQRNFGCSQY